MIRHLGLGVVLGSIVLGLSACGHGSSGAAPPRTTSGPAPPTSSGPDVWPGAVTVRVMTESGTPIPDVSVALNGGFDGQALDTDAEGWARFTNVNAGEASNPHLRTRLSRRPPPVRYRARHSHGT